ncbi:MAG: ZPR1 zinc finger domain-containing protein [Nanobdellota archaeon]
MADDEPAVLKGQTCPMCNKDTLTLTEQEREVPYLGNVFLFSMRCSNCGYKKSDVESSEEREPVKYTFDIESEDDLQVRFVKSAQATVKLPRILTIEPGVASVGYITNIEGLLVRAKDVIEATRDSTEDNDEKKKCRKLIKKLMRVMQGKDRLKITVEDPSGNSAIISEKAVKSNTKKK